MARIKDESVRAVVDAADMVEVVSGRTQLRKSGPRHMGRCPFHEERTPSFSVNAQDKLFYCFGCGKGGDVIGRIFEHLVARGDRPEEIIDYVAGMTDRFALSYAEKL